MPVVVLAAGLAAFLPAGPAGGDPGGWRHFLRPAEGVSYARKLTYDQRMLVGVASLNGEITRTAALTMTFRRVSGAAGGGSVTAVSYDSLDYAEDGILGRCEYSSRRNGAVPPAIRPLAAQVGRTFRVLADASGRITAISGTDDRSAEAILSFFPRGEVAVGGSWPWTLSVPLQEGSPSTLASTLLLKGMDGGVATIGLRSVLKPGPGGRVTDVGALAFGIGLSGTQEGEVSFDTATGLPLRGSLRQHFSGALRLAPGSLVPLASGEISVPMTGEGTLTLSPL